MAGRPDLIFHLAAIVSGEAERDFDKGYRINLDATRYLLEAARNAGHCPKIIFTSSIAVFGAPFPDVIADDYFTTPLTSYGTQKAIGELLASRLFPARVCRWGGVADADGLRAAGCAECGGVWVFFQHHTRTFGRFTCRVAGGRRRAALVCIAARGGGVSDPRSRNGFGGAWARAEH